MLPAEAVSQINNTLEKYPDSRSALLPALYIAQRHVGHLPLDALHAVATLLDLPDAHVRGVASFHVMFRDSPGGRHLVQLCTNVSCMLAASSGLLDVLKEHFGLRPGATSPDNRFTLLEGECIGECEKVPAMLVDSDVHTGLTAESIIEILARYE
ncbi:MAG: NAD(P)H-dependent oxidoreductase subunit E [Thermodesulfovibrionales bacterium]|nr:NAD(P)H-dependent oxidoreductase subunit E [Thermodesulfovibrionales bacterium]